jgi:hypothetical protein
LPPLAFYPLTGKRVHELSASTRDIFQYYHRKPVEFRPNSMCGQNPSIATEAVESRDRELAATLAR